MYGCNWLECPIIQYLQDIVTIQESIWRMRPDMIFETDIAHGGWLIFSASMLELNAAGGGPADARVLAVDIDIREHNREATQAHPMSRRITMLQGSSVAPEIVEQVRAHAVGRQRVLVSLNSNHTHEHVLAELQAYAPLVTPGSYCIVFDTVIEDMPVESFADRPWGPGNGPKSAVRECLRESSAFLVDRASSRKLLVSGAPESCLERVV